MTKTEQAPTDGAGPLDELRSELANYLGAKAKDLISSAAGSIPGLGSSDGDGPSGLAHFLPGGGGVKGLAGGMVKGTVGKAGGMVKGAADKATDTVKGAVGGGGSGAGDSKAMVITESIDVGLPRREVYDYWTDLESFSSFAKGVTSVSAGDDETESDWKLKVAFSNRSFKATVQEQIPDERIVWDSEGDKGTTHGAVSFHELTPDLTRVVVVVEYRPVGFFEKTGNIWRAQGRRLRLDLKRFQRYVTLTDEPPEGWRGEIQDGEVTRSHEDAVEEEEAEDDEAEETDEADESDEVENGEADDEEAEDEDDDTAEADDEKE
ncbi:SRPBCC family protein [Actinacidiphila yeochonensis]|uniref:SRPBCC family protein n=1 Tax=Actinacidiphila yeochonensis TaxID=89050 RepID=UPI000559CBB2|nr:SRPBCC family protein [Actinacidiphila yeochonensis]